MSEPETTPAPDDGWTTPAGWGGPAAAAAPAPVSLAKPGAAPEAGGVPAYGQPAPWGARPVELKPGVIPLRPLGLGEVLDGAVGVLRRYPRPSLGLAAIVAVVTTLISTLLSVTALRPLLELDTAALDSGSTEAFEDALGGAAAFGVVSVVLAVLSGAVLTGAITAVVGRAVLGQPMTLTETWAAVRPVLLRLIGLSLLTGLIIFAVVAGGAVVSGLLFLAGTAGAVIGSLLLVATAAAGLYVYVRLSLAPCALVLERTGLLDSLRRSGVLVARSWWRVAGVLALVFVIGAFVTLSLQVPFELFGAGSLGGLTDPDRDVLGFRTLVLSAIGSIVTATLVSPFTAGARALLYVDRRMRAEGLDVALAASARG